MKKKLWIIAAVIAIAAGVFFAFRPVTKSADPRPVVKIGISLPLTGDVARLGQSVRGALEIAHSEIPANSKYRYEIIFDDDQYEPRKIATNTNRQISVEKVDAVLSVFDGAAVSAPITNAAQIPNVGCTWGTAFFRDYPYSINHWSRTDTQARAFIELLKDEKIKSFAIVSVNFSSNAEVVENVKKLAAADNIKITSTTMITKGTKDFRTEIEKIRAQKPAVVMFLLLDPELGIFTKQAAELKLNIPFVAIDNIHSAQYKELLNGTKFVYSSIGTDEFNAKLDAKNIMPMACVANLYDGFKLLVSIYESADHKLTGEEVKDRLYQITDYPSALGVKISVDQDGIIDSPLIRARIENSQVVKY